MLVTGALPTISTISLEVMLNLYGKLLADYSAARLSAIQPWSYLRYGHATVLEALPNNLRQLNYTTCLLCFDNKFSIKIPEETIERGHRPEPRSVGIYTDSVKLNKRVVYVYRTIIMFFSSRAKRHNAGRSAGHDCCPSGTVYHHIFRQPSCW